MNHPIVAIIPVAARIAEAIGADHRNHIPIYAAFQVDRCAPNVMITIGVAIVKPNKDTAGVADRAGEVAR